MPLTQREYRPRLIDDQIGTMMESFGAVCIEGPKWCGKTWTSLCHASSVVYIGDPAGGFQNRGMAELDPKLVLSGEEPRLIDEWQEVPSLWDAVRFEVDRSSERGRFLLTGSSTPRRKGVLHSGAGRIGVVRMKPMSLFESGQSSGLVSLTELFENVFEPVSTGTVELRALADLIVSGGWPGCLGLSSDKAQLLSKSYLRLLVEEDASRVDEKKRDPHKMELLIRSLARNESTLANDSTLRRDMLQFEDETLSTETVSEYLSVLYRLFALYDQPSFNPNLRSSVRVGKKPKRHLADPSLAAAALGATSDRLMQDLNTFGFLFEALCERDLSVYAQAIKGMLSHYRDAYGREIDAVIELPDGRWGAFEIKLGANQIDAAARSLIKLRDEMESDPHAKPPVVLCVVCGLSSYAYVRSDGVAVVPITALKP